MEHDHVSGVKNVGPASVKTLSAIGIERVGELANIDLNKYSHLRNIRKMKESARDYLGVTKVEEAAPPKTVVIKSEEEELPIAFHTDEIEDLDALPAVKKPDVIKRPDIPPFIYVYDHSWMDKQVILPRSTGKVIKLCPAEIGDIRLDRGHLEVVCVWEDGEVFTVSAMYALFLNTDLPKLSLEPEARHEQFINAFRDLIDRQVGELNRAIHIKKAVQKEFS